MRDHVVFGASQGPPQDLALKIIFYQNLFNDEFVVKFHKDLREGAFLSNLKTRMQVLGLEVYPNEGSNQKGYRKYSARIEQGDVTIKPEDVWQIMKELDARLQGMDDSHFLSEEGLMEVRTDVQEDEEVMSKVSRPTQDVVEFLQQRFTLQPITHNTYGVEGAQHHEVVEFLSTRYLHKSSSRTYLVPNPTLPPAART